jgi:hypothetical protein
MSAFWRNSLLPPPASGNKFLEKVCFIQGKEDLAEGGRKV